MRTLIIITSYDREKLLYKLIKQLKNADIIVIDDASTFDFKLKTPFFRFPENYGKKRAWQKYQHIFKSMPKNYDFYIFIPDDVEVCDNFIEKSVKEYQNIKDKRKICLSLLSDIRITQINWTNFVPIEKGNVVLTQWMDLAFVCDNKFFDEVNLQPIDVRRWKMNPNASSGVGKMISEQLYAKGFNQYHVKNSLLRHIGFISKMNQDHQKPQNDDFFMLK